MATKISALQSLSEPAPDDLLVVVDVSDTTMSPTGTNKKILASTLIPTPNTVNVMSYGAVGDGTTDDTDAINAAIAACGTCGTVLFPGLIFKFSRLDDAEGNNITLQGVGFTCNTTPQYGGDWNGLAGANFGGTRLLSTATTGSALACTENGGGLHLRDLMIVGPGSGSSIGVEAGHASDAGCIRLEWRNVLVGNFAVGVAWSSQISDAYNLKLIGNSTGLKFVNQPNSNNFYNIEGTSNLVRTIECVGHINNFYGGVLQGNDGDIIYFSTTSEGFSFYGLYFENTGADNAVTGSGSPGANYHQFVKCHFGSADDTINVTGSYWEVMGTQAISGGINVTVNGLYGRLEGYFVGGISGDAAAIETCVVLDYGESVSAQLGQNSLRIRRGGALNRKLWITGNAVSTATATNGTTGIAADASTVAVDSLSTNAILLRLLNDGDFAGVIQTGGSGAYPLFVSPAGGGLRVGLGGVPVYADNAAALAGGLLVGRLYRTGADPDAVCIVH